WPDIATWGTLDELADCGRSGNAASLDDGVLEVGQLLRPEGRSIGGGSGSDSSLVLLRKATQIEQDVDRQVLEDGRVLDGSTVDPGCFKHDRAAGEPLRCCGFDERWQRDTGELVLIGHVVLK